MPTPPSASVPAHHPSVPAVVRALLALQSVTAMGCHREPTYSDDIAPILASRCIECHRPEGVGPNPSLGSFEQAAAAAPRIRHAVQAREMPPWGADNSGLCGTWRDALWLRDDEMRALVQWTKNPLPGAPSRVKLAPRAAPAFAPSGIVLDTGGDFRPGLGPAAYRCFVVGPADTRDRTATAFRIVSSEPRSVAHVTLYAIDSADGEAAATALDGEDAELGYSCFGSSRVPGARLLTSWTWDSPVSDLPPGAGVRVPGGRKLVAQLHYNPGATGLDVPTRTRIELEVDDSARVATYFTVAPESIRLPPGEPHTEVRVEIAAPRDLHVLGVAPRMHTLGKTMQLDRESSGSFRCMSSFDHWNFYKQRSFSFEAPQDIEAGSRLRLSCAYGTLGRNEPVVMGDGIEDEECRADLLVFDR